MAIDRLPSGRFRARLMIDRQRYTATLPTEADARIWEIQTRATVAMRGRAVSVTFAVYAARWLAQFLDDEPDRARFEAALEDRLLPVLASCRCSRCWTRTERNRTANWRTPVGAGRTVTRASAWSWSSTRRSTSCVPGSSTSAHGWAAADPPGESTGRRAESAGG